VVSIAGKASILPFNDLGYHAGEVVPDQRNVRFNRQQTIVFDYERQTGKGGQYLWTNAKK
jgi:hypothetical protein